MMEPQWLARLKHILARKPLVVLRFDDDDWDQICASRKGKHEFTFVRPRRVIEDVTGRTPCLIEASGFDGGLHVGVIESRRGVSNLDSRIKVTAVSPVQPESLKDCLKLLPDAQLATTSSMLQGDYDLVTLPPRVSVSLLDRLASILGNEPALRRVADAIVDSGHFDRLQRVQEDAVRTALGVFGLSMGDRAESVALATGRDTALTRINIREDAVIQHDARVVPGLSLVESDVTGRATFRRGDERLEIFTANRLELEEAFGVDLIYLNATRQNVVMLQYKMLEPEPPGANRPDWIYRPDAKFDEQLTKMRLFATTHAASAFEYRLNPEMFYLKFVKRDGATDDAAMITPLDHYETIRSTPVCQGPGGGLRISFNSLAGRYLRQAAFLDLVRSGYIGAYAETTGQIQVLIEAVLDGDRSLVAAVHERVRGATQGTSAGTSAAVDDPEDESTF
jgi:hypothetical protein